LLGLFILVLALSAYSTQAASVEQSRSINYIPRPWVYDGEATGDEMGYAVSSAGDVNGDGWDDILVGAPKATDGVNREGVAYLFYGSPQGPGSEPDWRVGGGQKGSEFGAAVGGAGDVNGDQYADIIVGAPAYGQPATGRVFIFYGSDTGPSTTADWIFEIGLAEARLGAAVDTAGSVDGDSYDEIVVGAPGYGGKGAAFVFYGSASGPITVTHWMTESNQASARFGVAVGGAGDLNDDGYADIVVGASGYERGETDEGAAFVFYGAETGLAPAYGWMAEGDQAGAEFGASVSSAGYTNDDRFADLVVGAPGYDTDTENVGAAWAFYGSEAGLGETPVWTTSSDQTSSGYGRAVGGAGDVNDDGYDEVIVGAYRYQNDHLLEGSAFVFFGSVGGLASNANWTVEGDKANATFGDAVAMAGDINQDGYADLMVGAPEYRVAGEIRGRVVVYFGSVQLFRSFGFLPAVLQSGP
jgi:hypothetical protein